MKWRNRKASQRHDRILAKLPEEDDAFEMLSENEEMLDSSFAFLMHADLRAPNTTYRKTAIKEKFREEEYEKVPRQAKTVEQKLPIKIEGRLIAQKPRITYLKPEEQEPITKPAPVKSEKKEGSESRPVKKATIKKQNKENFSLNDIKEKLASHASSLIEDPEKNVFF